MHSNSTATDQIVTPAETVPAAAVAEAASAGAAVPAGAGEPLGERIHESAEELAAPAAEAGECQDTASLIGGLGGLGSGLGGILSDRALKCDVVPVAWSR